METQNQLEAYYPLYEYLNKQFGLFGNQDWIGRERYIENRNLNQNINIFQITDKLSYVASGSKYQNILKDLSLAQESCICCNNG